MEEAVERKGEEVAERLRERGNSKMKGEDDYEAAIFFYSFALLLLRHPCQSPPDRLLHTLALLHGNRAEALLR